MYPDISSLEINPDVSSPTHFLLSYSLDSLTRLMWLKDISRTRW